MKKWFKKYVEAIQFVDTNKRIMNYRILWVWILLLTMKIQRSDFKFVKYKQ
jgi:hypothetical protein